MLTKLPFLEKTKLLYFIYFFEGIFTLKKQCFKDVVVPTEEKKM